MGTIHVIGWLGADPKMQYTQDGVAVTNFSVAENRKYTRGDGEEIEETQWYQVSAWGNLGEICNTYLEKGRQVYVEGRLSTHEYVSDFQGRKVARFSLDIRANQVTFLGGGGNNADEEEEETPPTAKTRGGRNAGKTNPPSANARPRGSRTNRQPANAGASDPAGDDPPF